MPERFEVYSHETTKLMKAAFEEAWEKVKAREDDPELSRKLLASAIIDQVNAGIQDRETIAPQPSRHSQLLVTYRRHPPASPKRRMTSNRHRAAVSRSWKDSPTPWKPVAPGGVRHRPRLAFQLLRF
jgi:hypothetical protein